MPLAPQVLEEIKERAKYALYQGFGFAKAAEYVAMLGGGAPPPGIKLYSPQHVLALVEAAEKGTPLPPAPPPAPKLVKAPEPPPEASPEGETSESKPKSKKKK